MLTSFDPWTVADYRPVLLAINRLAREHTSIFEAQLEHVAASAIRYGVKFDQGGLARGRHVQDVADPSKAALTTVKTAHASKRLFLRHVDHLPTRAMQTVHPMRRNRT